jgi:hypothetical protein
MTVVSKLFKFAEYLDIVVLCMEHDKNRFYVFIRGMKNVNLLAGKKVTVHYGSYPTDCLYVRDVRD